MGSFQGETSKRERKPYTRTKPYNWEKETDANYEDDINELGHFVCRYEECRKTFETKKIYLKHIFLTHEVLIEIFTYIKNMFGNMSNSLRVFFIASYYKQLYADIKMYN